MTRTQRPEQKHHGHTVTLADDNWLEVSRFIPIQTRHHFAASCKLFKQTAQQTALELLQHTFPDLFERWIDEKKTANIKWASVKLKQIHQSLHKHNQTSLSHEQRRARQLSWAIRAKNLKDFLALSPSFKELMLCHDPASKAPLWQLITVHRKHWCTAVFNACIIDHYKTDEPFYASHHLGLNPFRFGPNGTKLFWLACAFQQQKLAQTILKNDLTDHCRRNCYNNQRLGPMHLAGMLGNTALIKQLAAIGLDLDATTSDGDTPAMLARHFNHPEAEQLLKTSLAVRPSP